MFEWQDHRIVHTSTPCLAGTGSTFHKQLGLSVPNLLQICQPFLDCTASLASTDPHSSCFSSSPAAYCTAYDRFHCACWIYRHESLSPLPSHHPSVCTRHHVCHMIHVCSLQLCSCHCSKSLCHFFHDSCSCSSSQQRHTLTKVAEKCAFFGQKWLKNVCFWVE